MENLNVVNLIQASTITTGILGGLLLWSTKSKEFRGLAALLFCIAFASFINLLEETELTRNIYLISPAFIMLFGPAIYLATKLLINKVLEKHDWWHLLPVIPILLLTSHTYAVIAIGTVWRLGYALLTVLLLVQYKRTMDEERSDSDDFSLRWLVWVLTITAAFNLIDLIRLNLQQYIPYDINILGQGINNAVWLVAAMVIIIKLQSQQSIPKSPEQTTNTPKNNTPDKNNYHSIFEELDKIVTTNQWFLKPRISLNDMSNLTGLQTRDISRAINLVAQQSFNEYINHYRVRYVCDTLTQNPQQTLTNIAFDAGFSSKASFNKVFKAITGTTPTEYKTKNA